MIFCVSFTKNHHYRKEPQIIQIWITILRIYFELRAEGGRPPLAEVVPEDREGILLESSLRRVQTPLHENQNWKMSIREHKVICGRGKVIGEEEEDEEDEEEEEDDDEEKDEEEDIAS